MPNFNSILKPTVSNIMKSPFLDHDDRKDIFSKNKEDYVKRILDKSDIIKSDLPTYNTTENGL